MKEFLKRTSVVVALILVLVIAVYAWLAMWDHANLQNVDMSIIEAGYIRVSEDDGATWDNNLTLDLGEANVLGELLGDGLNLYQPDYGVSGIDSYRLYTDRELFIEKVFTFETDHTQSIYLAPDSYISPADLNDNLSAYGQYTRNYIAGAIRVGFYDITNPALPQLIYLWAPNSTYEFTETVDAETEEAISMVNENGSVEDAYTYQTGVSVDQMVVIPTNGNTSGVSENGAFVWGSPAQQAAKPILSFTTQNGKPIQKKLMVRIFMEGSDRECVRQLHNGRIRAYFNFNSNKEGTVNG